MFIDKIQYSFIYKSYKFYRRSYRKGKGYQYIGYVDAAHRTIGIFFALTSFIVSAILTGKVAHSNMNVLVGIGAVLACAIYLDISVSKKKMLRYRHIYSKRKNYIIYYFLLLAGLIGVAIFYRTLVLSID
jgi:cation transport ATPase